MKEEKFKMYVCIGVVSVLTNTNNTFKYSGKLEGVRKFVIKKQSYKFVYVLMIYKKNSLTIRAS
jgi:hypothetical protein